MQASNDDNDLPPALLSDSDDCDHDDEPYVFSGPGSDDDDEGEDDGSCNCIHCMGNGEISKRNYTAEELREKELAYEEAHRRWKEKLREQEAERDYWLTENELSQKEIDLAKSKAFRAKQAEMAKKREMAKLENSKLREAREKEKAEKARLKAEREALQAEKAAAKALLKKQRKDALRLEKKLAKEAAKKEKEEALKQKENAEPAAQDEEEESHEKVAQEEEVQSTPVDRKLLARMKREEERKLREKEEEIRAKQEEEEQAAKRAARKARKAAEKAERRRLELEQAEKLRQETLRRETEEAMKNETVKKLREAEMRRVTEWREEADDENPVPPSADAVMYGEAPSSRPLFIRTPSSQRVVGEKEARQQQELKALQEQAGISDKMVDDPNVEWVDECVVCLHRPRQVEFTPCGHAVCCLSCGYDPALRQRCPACAKVFMAVELLAKQPTQLRSVPWAAASAPSHTVIDKTPGKVSSVMPRKLSPQAKPFMGGLSNLSLSPDAKPFSIEGLSNLESQPFSLSDHGESSSFMPFHSEENNDTSIANGMPVFNSMPGQSFNSFTLQQELEILQAKQMQEQANSSMQGLNENSSWAPLVPASYNGMMMEPTSHYSAFQSPNDDFTSVKDTSTKPMVTVPPVSDSFALFLSQQNRTSNQLLMPTPPVTNYSSPTYSGFSNPSIAPVLSKPSLSSSASASSVSKVSDLSKPKLFLDKSVSKAVETVKKPKRVRAMITSYQDTDGLGHLVLSGTPLTREIMFDADQLQFAKGTTFLDQIKRSTPASYMNVECEVLVQGSKRRAFNITLPNREPIRGKRRIDQSRFGDKKVLARPKNPPSNNSNFDSSGDQSRKQQEWMKKNEAREAQRLQQHAQRLAKAAEKRLARLATKTTAVKENGNKATVNKQSPTHNKAHPNKPSPVNKKVHQKKNSPVNSKVYPNKKNSPVSNKANVSAAKHPKKELNSSQSKKINKAVQPSVKQSAPAPNPKPPVNAPATPTPAEGDGAGKPAVVPFKRTPAQQRAYDKRQAKLQAKRDLHRLQKLGKIPLTPNLPDENKSPLQEKSKQHDGSEIKKKHLKVIMKGQPGYIVKNVNAPHAKKAGPQPKVTMFSADAKDEKGGVSPNASVMPNQNGKKKPRSKRNKKPHKKAGAPAAAAASVPAKV